MEEEIGRLAQFVAATGGRVIVNGEDVTSMVLQEPFDLDAGQTSEDRDPWQFDRLEDQGGAEGAMTDYPRVCRNGHTIDSAQDEHIGEHRQCWRCRRRTQAEADERYEATDRGSYIRQSYEWRVRNTVQRRTRIGELSARLGREAPEGPDYVALSNERLREQRAMEWCEEHGRRPWKRGVGYCCEDEAAEMKGA
jgi:hypothetical protein